MKHVIIKCDECQNDGAKSYSVIIDRIMDASGNSYENQYKHYDWCFECLIKYAQNNPSQKILEN